MATDTLPTDALPTEKCDLLMKGGITSGVIFPRLISELAQRYRFCNIGGTSAGAIAAAACAAAEHRRYQPGQSDAGFQKLSQLPDELGKSSGRPARHSKLFSLFQPSPALAKHFAALESALNKQAGPAAVSVITSLLKTQFAMALIGALAAALLLAPFFCYLIASTDYGTGLAIGLVSLAIVAVAAAAIAVGTMRGDEAALSLSALAGIAIATACLLGWLLHVKSGPESPVRLVFGVVASLVLCTIALTLVLVGVAARFAYTLLAGLHANGYGCCSGQTPPGSANPALTDWLTDYLNDVAGLPIGGDPLTFGDLWGPSDERQVNLQVMTSAVSQNMAFSIPFREGTLLFYDPKEWGRLFPSSVMQWLSAVAQRAPRPAGGAFPPGVDVRNAAGDILLPLPKAADLPVIVAVRMSLSFPVLLSAVPLYAIDWSRKVNKEIQLRIHAQVKAKQAVHEQYMAQRVWFSDGGITSNLPIFMFDALLPRHPTFAVNLEDVHPDYPLQHQPSGANQDGRVYLPESENSGSNRYWPAPPDDKPFQGLAGFLGSIFGTMHSWRDEIMFPYPGFRDRILQIKQGKGEGGMNLDMPAESIEALALAGKMGADRLVDRFHPSGAQHGEGWTDHQVVRMKTFLGLTQPALTKLSGDLLNGPWRGYVSSHAGYSTDEKSVADRFRVGYADLGVPATGNGPVLGLDKTTPRPTPQIAVTPKI